MYDIYIERFRWVLKEGLMIAAILVFWRAVALLIGQGIGSTGTFQSSQILRMAANQLANAAVQVGLASAILYVLVRVGTKLIDYYRE
jgi:hypothetical protein